MEREISMNGFKKARTCYDHIAGEIGVTIYKHFLELKWIYIKGKKIVLTSEGNEGLSKIGIDVEELKKTSRPEILCCIDSTEKKPHLAGKIGALILKFFLENGLAHKNNRVLSFTSEGEKKLVEFGVNVKERTRCTWCDNDPILIEYHDNSWGRKVTEDYLLFEFLTLEIFQAGLKWRTVLEKRQNLRKAFKDFNFNIISEFDNNDIIVLMNNEGIIRNRRKIEATIYNSIICRDLLSSHGSLYNFFRKFPAIKDDKKRNLKKTFKHVGLITAESFFVATGLIETPHDKSCFLSDSN